MYHPYAHILRKHRMIACYHRLEHEALTNIDWLANDAYGDWRHEIILSGKIGTLLYMEDHIADTFGNPILSCESHVQLSQDWTFSDARSNMSPGPAVKREGLGEWGAPTVFWNNSNDVSVLSPPIEDVETIPLWVYENPLNLIDAPTNDGLSVMFWYKLTDDGICLDTDGDGYIETDSFEGTMIEIENFDEDGNEASISDQFHLIIDLDYNRASSVSNNACVNIVATLTNKPADPPAGDSAVAETDYTNSRYVGSITNNEWHCVLVRVIAGKVDLYVDGKFFDSDTGGCSVPSEWHPRARVNGTVSGTSFDGVDQIAFGPVAIYDDVNLGEYEAYRLWASMRRPLDIAVEGWWYDRTDLAGPQSEPDDPPTPWYQRGMQPQGWKSDGQLDSPHTWTGRRAEYRGDNRFVQMRRSARWYRNDGWHEVKFRALMNDPGIYNRDANLVTQWDGVLHWPPYYGQGTQMINSNFFFDYHKYHIGFHMESNRNESGLFMVLGVDHHAHREVATSDGGAVVIEDHRQGPVTYLDNWIDAGGIGGGGWNNACDGLACSLEGGATQPCRGVEFKYHPVDGWVMRYSGHDGTVEGADMDETLTSNLTMIPNMYNAVIMGTGQDHRVIRQGYNTRSGVLNPDIGVHEVDDLYGNGRTGLPLDNVTSRPQEFDQAIDTDTLRNTPGLPAEYGHAEEPKSGNVDQLGSLDGTGSEDRMAYDFDRVGPLAFMLDQVPGGTYDRVLRLLQGQHSMRSRPGLRSPLRHIHLNAPMRVTK